MSPLSQASIGIQFISVCEWVEVGSYYYVVMVGLELVIFLLQLLNACVLPRPSGNLIIVKQDPFVFRQLSSMECLYSQKKGQCNPSPAL